MSRSGVLQKETWELDGENTSTYTPAAPSICFRLVFDQLKFVSPVGPAVGHLLTWI